MRLGRVAAAMLFAAAVMCISGHETAAYWFDAPSDAAPNSGSGESAEPSRDFKVESIRGQVDWTADILERRFGIETDPDAAQWSIALEAEDGRVLPIVKDNRGRGFFIDERLRGIDMELYVRHYHDSPMIQIIRVYTLHDGKKYELDYWCDICAIPMYELKACECCQGPTRLRERLVEETVAGETPSEEADH